MSEPLADEVQGYVGGFLVTLDKDRKDESAQAVLDAIRMVKGVQSVDPVTSDGGLNEALFRSRLAKDLTDELWGLVRRVAFGKED